MSRKRPDCLNDLCGLWPWVAAIAKQLDEVEGGTNHRPFPFHLPQPTHQKAPIAEYVFDHAKHWLYHPASFPIEILAGRRLESCPHLLGRRSLWRMRRQFSRDPIGPAVWWDQQISSFALLLHDAAFVPIPGIGRRQLRNLSGSLLYQLHHRLQLLLVGDGVGRA